MCRRGGAHEGGLNRDRLSNRQDRGDDGDGAGYHSYHVPDGETSEEPTTTVVLHHHQVTDPPPAEVATEPIQTARWHGLLVAAALIALVALILTVLL